jgi:hypothetical protein
MTDQPPRDVRKARRTGRAGAVTPPTEAAQAARQARLAGALRDNLGRRKAQARTRRPASAGPAADEDPGGETGKKPSGRPGGA